MGLLSSILSDTIYHTTPILLCVLGGIPAYKANVLNIALEGLMLAGAFVSVLTAFYTGSLFLACVLAVAACLVIGLVFSFMSVTYKGNVIVVGLAVNMFVPAVAGFALQQMGMANITLSWLNVADLKIHIPLIDRIPLIGNIVSGHPPITYVSFAAIALLAVLMYRTRFGIYTRVIGENEDAAVSLGLKTNQYKYAAVLTGALFCALAGVNLALERLALFTNNMTAGRGFIAIAAIYCGRGEPGRSAFYAFLFGLARALAVNLSIYAGAEAALFDVIPYVVMTLVLAAVSIVKRRYVRERSFL
jgi:simple sugar transport system permease protein